MKGFSIPNISIPSVSIPHISISGGIDAGSIKSAITSALPDLSSVTKGLDIEGVASNLLSEAVGEGVDLPPEITNLLK